MLVHQEYNFAMEALFSQTLGHNGDGLVPSHKLQSQPEESDFL